MATTTTYTIGGATSVELGNVQDILDVVINISPKDTPFLSSIAKTGASGVKHEWVYDTLRAAVQNAAVEGAPATYAASAARARDYNICQILRNTITVSETQRKVKKVAVEDEMAYQLAKELPAHALDLEYMLIRNTTRTAGDDSTARLAGGLTVFVDGYATDNGNTVNKAGAPYSEDDFNGQIQEAWNDGGMVDTVMCAGAHKRRISKFNASSQKNVDATSKALTMAIDIYDSDFGRVKMIPNRNVPYTTAGDTFFLEMKRFKLAVLRPTTPTDMAKTGDSYEKMVVTEATLEGLAPKANACIKNASADVI